MAAAAERPTDVSDRSWPDNDHDSGYKFLFSTPELVRDLIIGFVPDEWLHSLDYSTLERVPGSYVSEDFRYCAGDIVWRVRVGGEQAQVPASRLG